MQKPIYKFHPGQEVFVELDGTKSTVVAIVDDKFNDEFTLRLVVTKQWLPHRKMHSYKIYREYEASTMMYMLAREAQQDKDEKILRVARKWEIDRVMNFDKKGNLVVVPENEWCVTEFSKKKKAKSKMK